MIKVSDFLAIRRKRALGAILGWADRELTGTLNEEQRAGLRKAVTEGLNQFYDAALDLHRADTDEIAKA